jgi:hypothetical protein
VLDHNPADELLVLVATVIFVLVVYALRMVRSLRRHLNGVSGSYLLRIVFRFGIFVAAAQFLTVTNAILRLADRMGTYDTRLMILLVGETLIAGAFLWTVWEIHHLPADVDGDCSPAQGSKALEGVPEQVDDTAPSAGAPVDQRHDDAPVAPV